MKLMDSTSIPAVYLIRSWQTGIEVPTKSYMLLLKSRRTLRTLPSPLSYIIRVSFSSSPSHTLSRLSPIIFLHRRTPCQVSFTTHSPGCCLSIVYCMLVMCYFCLALLSGSCCFVGDVQEALAWCKTWASLSSSPCMSFLLQLYADILILILLVSIPFLPPPSSFPFV